MGAGKTSGTIAASSSSCCLRVERGKDELGMRSARF